MHMRDQEERRFAVSIKHDKNYYVGARPIPLVDPGFEPIKELVG